MLVFVGIEVSGINVVVGWRRRDADEEERYIANEVRNLVLAERLLDDCLPLRDALATTGD